MLELHFAGLSGVILLLCLLASVGCRPPASDQGVTGNNAATNAVAKSYSVKGVVREVKMDGKTVVIRHEEIPGYMAAMTMPFEFRPASLTRTVHAGDLVRFRLQVTAEDGWVDQVEVTGRAAAELAPQTNSSVRAVRDVEPLKVGDLMPDYGFTNEFGKAIRLSDFKGRALAFTFIFTRCPFPNFCPRMSENFNQTYRKLASNTSGPTNYQFLSISFDPAFDTPSVLRQYAGRYSYDSNHWSFATGALIDIDAITEQFGLYFSREGGTVNFNHNLRTVVVDVTGRIQAVLIGNEWKPEELAEAMLKAALPRP